jgi:acetyl esterase/lipase
VAIAVLPATLLASPNPAAGAIAGETQTASCRTVTYTPTTASRAQVATLCVPRQVSARTAMLLIHGGGGYSGSRSALHAWQAFYARHGIVTLSIDYTLTGEGGTPTFPRPEQNAKAAVQYLRLHEDELGTDRVVVQGHSSGARLGAILLTTPDDTSFAGRELHRGVSDSIDGFIGYYGYYGGNQFRPAAYYGGAANRDANSVANARRASGAALLFHGRADSLVPANRSMRFERALRRAGGDARLVLVAGNHCFDGYGMNSLTATGTRSARLAVQWLREAEAP